jgi:hypothetical protein
MSDFLVAHTLTAAHDLPHRMLTLKDAGPNGLPTVTLNWNIFIGTWYSEELLIL